WLRAYVTPSARTSQRSKSIEWQISNGPFRADKECNPPLTFPNLYAGRQSCYALTCSGVGCRINSQYFHKFCDLSQVTQRIARRFVISAKDVHKENVFPGTATQRTRFDLTEIDIAQGKDAQRLEEYTRHILEGKTNRGLVGPLADLFGLADQQKARVVLLVVFNPGQQHPPSILSGRLLGGDRRRVVQLFGDNVANASGGIVERHRLDARVRPKELPALVQRHRMREHLPYRVHLHARHGNQVVTDAQIKLTMHEHLPREQQVEVLGHRTGKRILD